MTVKPEDIPKEVVEAYVQAWLQFGTPSAAVAAILNAWPGSRRDVVGGRKPVNVLTLPLAKRETVKLVV